MSSEEQTNFLPRALGSMALRPGLEHLLSSLSDAQAVYIPFVYSMTETALLECTSGYLRPLVSEAPITRASVSTTVTNGDFSSGTGWTIVGTGGGNASITGGKLLMASTPIDSYATVSRSVSVSGGDQGVEHAFRVIVERGPVYFRCGTASGDDDLISTTKLDTGYHSLAFTPNVATIYIAFESRLARQIIVDSVQIEGSGVMTLPAPWTADDLPLLRWTQSGDVIFLAHHGHIQRKIERRATRSWSLVEYKSDDGPFFAAPTDPNVKMSVNVALGNATLTASRPFFKSTHAGALFRIFTPGYNFTFDLAQADCWTPAVRVNGVGGARTVSVQTSGTWSGTLTVQKSFTDEFSGFSDSGSGITTNTTTSVTDTADNVAVWVRVGFKTGGYTSGTATVQLVFGTGGGGGGSGQGATSGSTSTGGRTGVCRVTQVNSATAATVEILQIFSSTETSLDWAESEWSDRQGWPSAVGIHESRMTWAGRDRLWASVSDDYTSYDNTVEGDSGPLQRSIGFGPIQVINWVLPLSRMLLGTEAAEVAVRSSTFDEPLTPTNFALKDISTYGSKRCAAVKVDSRGVFADRSGQNLLEMAYDVQANDYITSDLTRLCPDLFLNNTIQRIAVQRRPDTRIHCVRADGTVAVVVYEPLEDVRCWWIVETDGDVEDVVALPAVGEDKVYYLVKRTINGSTKRYLERFAKEDECVGAALNKQADSFITYTSTATTTISGLSHLEGEEVIVWADGSDLSPEVDGVQTTYTVSSGAITLASAKTNVVVGLPYRARYKSVKLAYAAQGGTALTKMKRVNQLGFILHKTHCKGIKHGRDYDNLDPLPSMVDGAAVTADTIHAHYDYTSHTHPGNWDSDSRLHLEANAPRPVTVLGLVLEVNTNG